MKALVFERCGEAQDVLRVGEVSEPSPKPGEVVVQMQLRPIHPSDLSFVRGTYRLPPVLPQVAGLSGMGRIVSPTGSHGLADGARVAFRWPGTWAERVAVPAGRLLLLPQDISDPDGAQLPLNPITAWGLLEVAGVRAGQWVGVTAPASSVSKLVWALAELRGARVVAIDRSTNSGFSASVRDLTGGAGLAAVLDSVGGSLLTQVFSALQPGATIVAYGTLSPDPVTVQNATLVYSNLTWVGFGIDRWLDGIDARSREHMLETLYAALRAKRLTLPVRAQVPLPAFQEALQGALHSGAGKVLLK